METYSVELATELKDMVKLDVRALPGRPDGRPPSLGRLALFLVAACINLWRRRRMYDIVHFGDFVLFPLAYWHSLIAPNHRRVVTVHGLDLLYGRQKGVLPAMYGTFLTWARHQQCVHHFIANSCHTAGICENAGFLPVVSIPLGVRLPDWPQQRSVGRKYVLFVGRVVARKGTSWFTEQVLPRLPSEVELWVVGRIWDEAEGRALARHPRVRVFGHVSEAELAKLRTGAVAIVMPNIAATGQRDVEGFGLVALEGAAIGVPVIAARTEGLTDAVRQGETGFLVESGNADAWVEQLNMVLAWNDEQRLDFSDGARASLSKHFTWSRVAKETVAVYRECVGSNDAG
jgi:glycosyltransferase involved in cell wall biosynthesis